MPSACTNSPLPQPPPLPPEKELCNSLTYCEPANISSGVSERRWMSERSAQGTECISFTPSNPPTICPPQTPAPPPREHPELLTPFLLRPRLPQGYKGGFHGGWDLACDTQNCTNGNDGWFLARGPVEEAPVWRTGGRCGSSKASQSESQNHRNSTQTYGPPFREGAAVQVDRTLLLPLPPRVFP